MDLPTALKVAKREETKEKWGGGGNKARARSPDHVLLSRLALNVE